MKGVAYEVSEGEPITIPLADQGPVLHGSPAESWSSNYRREDGTLMVPSVPTITDAIPTFTGGLPMGNESSEATDASPEGDPDHATSVSAPSTDENSPAARRRRRLRRS